MYENRFSGKRFLHVVIIFVNIEYIFQHQTDPYRNSASFDVPDSSPSSSRNKSQMAPNEKVPFHEKLGLRSKTPGKLHVFDRENPVFEETMKDRGSIDEHFALCGSA